MVDGNTAYLLMLAHWPAASAQHLAAVAQLQVPCHGHHTFAAVVPVKAVQPALVPQQSLLS